MQPIISVSIVLYHTEKKLLEKCLNCLLLSLDESSVKQLCEIFIIDNSCSANYFAGIEALTEDLKKQYSDADFKLSAAPKNLGYGAGHNLAIKQIRSDYHIVLNADVFTDPDTIKNALEFMNDHLDVGLLSPKVRGEDGKQHFLCRQNPNFFTQFLRSFAPGFIKNKFQARLDAITYKDHDYNSVIYNVPFLTGCFMFFRTSVLKKIKGFDERYFLYMEDADITRETLQVAGTAYVPSVTAVHLWTRAIHSSWKHKCYAIKSSLQYFLKWLKYA